APHALARLPQSERILSRRRALALRDALVASLVVGLAVSITLSETSLVVLAAWLVWTRRARTMSRASWPLLAPVLAFSAWSILTAALSSTPLESLRATKTLLPLATLWIVFGVLAVASAVALGLTLVRGAWLGFGAGVLFALTGVRRWSIAVAVVAAAVLLLLAVPRVRQRAETIADPADPTARERFAMFDAGLTMLR